METPRFLKNINRFKSSFLPDDLMNKEVIEAEVLKTKEEKYYNGGNYYEIEKVRIKNMTSTVFLIHIACWGFDDVDESTYAFENLADAESCYSHFVNFSISDIKSNGVVARIIRPEQNHKFISNAINHNGYLATEKYGGDLFLAYFNIEKVKELGLETEARALKEADVRSLVGTKFEPALIKWGDNGNGLIVQTEDEYRIEKKQVFFEHHHCWELGLNYQQLLGKYPTEVWNLIKPLLAYHSEELEEEGDWIGWYTTNLEEVNNVLQKIGWSC